MASALSEKLSGLVKKISGQARITESNVSDMLREVRLALLEADVALPVVRDFMARVKEQALGQQVLGSLTPGQALVGIVQRELAATMGEGVADLNLAAQPPAVILMAGLQGAGKTTTTAKLARHLIDKRKNRFGRRLPPCGHRAAQNRDGPSRRRMVSQRERAKAPGHRACCARSRQAPLL
jgi:signal recognition particle subunit SRP54